MRPKSSRAALAGLLLLGACSPGNLPPLYVVEEPAAAGMCRLGPDEGPPLADRGIGGTGAPTAVADRGIGGTGTPLRTADRGIGGTGIIAVITGFASICLGGMEVALDDTVPVTLNGEAVPASSLRAGQLAIVEAGGQGSELAARSVELRQEVSGPVEAVATNGRLRVAGQAVQLSAGTYGQRNPQVGDWIAVSGLRSPDGVIQASRIDPRTPGEVLVRGRAVATPGGLRVGTLQLRSNETAPAGYITATGRYRGGVLDGARLAPDRLATDPAAAFPEATRRILVESYAVAGPGGLRLGSGATLPALPGLVGQPMRGMVEIERQPGGGLRATGLRPDGPAAFGGDRGVLPGAFPGRSMGEGGPGRGLGSQPAPVPRPMIGGTGGEGGAGVRRGAGVPQLQQGRGGRSLSGGEGVPAAPGAGAPAPSPPGAGDRPLPGWRPPR